MGCAVSPRGPPQRPPRLPVSLGPHSRPRAPPPPCLSCPPHSTHHPAHAVRRRALLAAYASPRRVMKMETPPRSLPEGALEDVRRLPLIMQRLDRGRMICDLNGVKPGMEIELSREHVISVFATTHTIP